MLRPSSTSLALRVDDLAQDLLELLEAFLADELGPAASDVRAQARWGLLQRGASLSDLDALGSAVGGTGVPASACNG